MKDSIVTELTEYIKDKINDGVLTVDNFDEWHHLAFNQDYYIVYYSEADKWLARHGINPFHAVAECVEYETDNFGESNGTYNNSESTVNMLAFIYGEELLSDIGRDLLDLMTEINEKKEELTDLEQQLKDF